MDDVHKKVNSVKPRCSVGLYGWATGSEAVHHYRLWVCLVVWAAIGNTGLFGCLLCSTRLGHLRLFILSRSLAVIGP
jgi:hypothetical protein